MMMNKRLMVSLLMMCAVALVFTGCRRKRAPGAISLDSTQPPIVQPYDAAGSGTDLGGTGSGSLSPRATVFTDGQAVNANLAAILFDFDSAQVADPERAKAEAVAEYLKSNGDCVAVLEGHCDERGSAEYNMSLGERRALAVRAYLVTLGVDPARLQTRSFGAEKPVQMGHDEEAWRLNRRVEFAVMK
jgi:peptidoglycan-associated lipoprotein